VSDALDDELKPFNARCGQLAELRNTIQHSRPMTDVTRMDGEAALPWFSEAVPPDRTN
jgi:hypothetical protein